MPAALGVGRRPHFTPSSSAIVPGHSQSTNGESRFGTLKPRTGKTSFIVNEKGYLQESLGATKINNAFTHKAPVTHKSAARWPQVCAQS